MTPPIYHLARVFLKSRKTDRLLTCGANDLDSIPVCSRVLLVYYYICYVSFVEDLTNIHRLNSIFALKVYPNCAIILDKPFCELCVYLYGFWRYSLSNPFNSSMKIFYKIIVCLYVDYFFADYNY